MERNEMTKLSASVEEAKEITGLRESTIQRMIALGKIKVARVGRRVLIPMSELERISKPGADTGVISQRPKASAAR
jgi:excisionase family DNA binding protein